MPRRKKLPPNLHWRSDSPNIHFKIEVDGRVFQGSTHTADIPKAMELLELEQEKAWNEIRFGRTEKRDLNFSEAFDIAWNVRAWGELDEKGQARELNHKRNIIEALGDFKLSSINREFRSRYSRARQDVAKKLGRKPYSALTINAELAKVTRVLLSLDDRADEFVLPRKVQLKGKGYLRYPIEFLPVTKAEAERHTTLAGPDEVMTLVAAMVPHARPIVITAFLTGLRKSEVHNINVQDIDLEVDTIHVIQKGGKEHVAPIHPDLRPLLVELIGDRKRGPLFVYGQNNCECSVCAKHRKAATSGKPHYVTGDLNRPYSNKRVKNIELGLIFNNASVARREMIRLGHYGCNAGKIGDVCKGKKATAGGFHWEYVAAPNQAPVVNLARKTGRIKSIDRTFQTARERIGRPDVRFHDLRHSIATYLVSHGTPLSVVSELLGHSDIATTMRYVKRDRHTVARFLSDKVSMTEQKVNESVEISLSSTALTNDKAHLKAVND